MERITKRQKDTQGNKKHITKLKKVLCRQSVFFGGLCRSIGRKLRPKKTFWHNCIDWIFLIVILPVKKVKTQPNKKIYL